MSNAGTSNVLEAEPVVVRRQKPRQQPRYNVVLLDDNDHSYDYVVRMLKTLFGYQPEKGFEMAAELDNRKRVILMTTSLELAELKQQQIHSFGPDPLIPASAGSMSAELEPVE
jgi:ATP-dependent Clp protease adaptor protein ClpS